MPLFLLSYFIIYGLMNVYVLNKARAALGLSKRLTLPILVFMSLMILAPVIIRLAERNDYPSVAVFLSYIGYFWLGFIFLFVSCALVIDTCRCLARIAAISLGREVLPGHLSVSMAFFIPLFTAIAIGCYGIFEAADIRTEHVVLHTNKLLPTAGRVRIVQISDVHLGLIVRESRLTKILAAIKKANPDLLVSTGDLVDGQMNDLDKLTQLFQEIKPPFGKYAVTGNHEYYAGLDHALTFTKQAGFVLMQGKTELTAEGRIILAGVDDETARQRDPYYSPDEQEIIKDIPADLFIILLKHRPQFNSKSRRRPDLQLSGHTHKGQIFPFRLVTSLFFPVPTGYSVPTEGSSLYVSRGTGTWGPPIRFLAPPEITIIDLLPINVF